MKPFITFFLIAQLLIAPAQAAIKGRWSMFVYIAGDDYFHGPTYGNESGADAEDQANRLYRMIHKSALENWFSSFILFYDPKGSPLSWFDNRWVKRVLIHDQEPVIPFHASLSEVDQSDSDHMKWMANSALSKLGSLLWKSGSLPGYRFFYYYGEYIPITSSPAHDLSHPSSKMSVSRLRQNFQTFKSIGGFDLVFMQSCYSNNLKMLDALLTQSDLVVVPRIAVPNSAPPIQNLIDFAHQFQPLELAKALKSKLENSSYPFQLKIYDRTLFLEIKKIIKQAEKSIVTEPFNEDLKKKMTLEQASEISNNIVLIPESNDILLPIQEYLRFLQRYTLEPALLEQLLHKIAQDPEIYDIFVPLEPILPVMGE